MSSDRMPRLNRRKYDSIGDLETHAGDIAQKLRGFAFKHFKLQPADADDLVQITFEKAVKSRDTFHGGDLMSWLSTILANSYKDARNARRLKVVREDAASKAIEGQLSKAQHHQAPDELIIGGEKTARIMEIADQTLPTTQAIALKLYVNGENQQSIADQMNSSVEAVEGLLARARIALRDNPDVQALRDQ